MVSHSLRRLASDVSTHPLLSGLQRVCCLPDAEGAQIYQKSGGGGLGKRCYSTFSNSSITIFNALMRAYFLSTLSNTCQGA